MNAIKLWLAWGLFVLCLPELASAQDLQFENWGGCMTGPAGRTSGVTCSSLDDDSDGSVSMVDFVAFQQNGPSPCTFGHQYAFAIKPQAATGCSAKIRTVSTVLCGEPHDVSEAASVAWVGVAIFQGETPEKWAQTGYERHRNAGSTTVVVRRYAEMLAGPLTIDYRIAFAAAPAVGIHQYRCYQITSLVGTWEFDYDGTTWQQFSHVAWQNVQGTHCLYEAEIFNKEDQLVGTPQDRCEFTECQYAEHWGAFQDADISGNTRVGSTNLGEWGTHLTSIHSFEVWDRKP